MFSNRMEEKFVKDFNVKFVVPESADKAIKEADIITTVTTSRKPNTPEMQETDSCILTELADKIYLDTRDGALNESGDFIIPMKEGTLKEDRITGEIGEVIMGTVKARERDDEVTYFKITGSAVLDAVTAQRIYEKAMAKGIGEFIEL